ncbi:MAG: hypothetical protein V4563_17735 [Pseudomonadota bacterium]
MSEILDKWKPIHKEMGLYSNGETRMSTEQLGEIITALEQSASDLQALRADYKNAIDALCLAQNEIDELRAALLDASQGLEHVRGVGQHCNEYSSFETASEVVNKHNGFHHLLQPQASKEPCPNNCIDGVIVKFGGGEFDMLTSKCPIHHPAMQSNP